MTQPTPPRLPPPRLLLRGGRAKPARRAQQCATQARRRVAVTPANAAEFAQLAAQRSLLGAVAPHHCRLASATDCPAAVRPAAVRGQAGRPAGRNSPAARGAPARGGALQPGRPGQVQPAQGGRTALSVAKDYLSRDGGPWRGAAPAGGAHSRSSFTRDLQPYGSAEERARQAGAGAAGARSWSPRGAEASLSDD